MLCVLTAASSSRRLARAGRKKPSFFTLVLQACSVLLVILLVACCDLYTHNRYKSTGTNSRSEDDYSSTSIKQAENTQ